MIAFTKRLNILEFKAVKYSKDLFLDLRANMPSKHTLHILYTVQQGSPTFCGRWAKKWKNYKPFLLRAINSYFFAISPKIF